MINRLLRLTWFPLAFQLLALGAFVLLIVGGLAADTNDMAFANVLRNTNAANLIVWSYWWPLVILSAVFLGRAWCMVCPMELVTSLASKVGLKREPPAFLRSGWVITAFYILILFVGVHTLAIHRVPFRMAFYMICLLVMAGASGLLFSRNAFCAYICPVGHLLGLYARLAPIGWGVRDKSLCAHCKDRSCISNRTAYRFQGRSCGVGLNPANLNDNTSCLLCGQCLKACDQNNPGIAGRPNPGWFPRRWFKDLLDLGTYPETTENASHGQESRVSPGVFGSALKPMTAAQATFCLIVSGFVVYEIFTEWPVTKDILLWTPTKLEQTLGLSGAWGKGFVKSLTLFVALPAVFWLLPFAAFRLAGGRTPLGDYLFKFGIAFIPIMAAAHVVKTLLKTTSRIPYWEYALTDPVGIETARGISDKTLPLAALPAWRDPAITALAPALIAVSIVLSFLVVRKLIAAHTPESGWRAAPLYLIPGIYGGAFFIMLIAWRLF